jgi:hypothetical protein
MKITFLVLPLFLLTKTWADPHFAQGVMENGIKWQARFNMPDCEHQGQKKGAWCLDEDKKAAVEKSGIESQLISWMYDENVKGLYVSYLSFSNYTILNALCDVSKTRNIKVQIYVDTATERILDKNSSCGKKFKVELRGKGPYGAEGAHLQHMKIFLASPTEELPLWSELSAKEREDLQDAQLRFTSSSANMSSYGTNLHFENWLFFTSNLKQHTGQKNLCVFKAFAAGNDREVFSNAFNQCVQNIFADYDLGIRMFVAPNSLVSENPYISGMKKVLLTAKSSLKLAVHRLTTGLVVKPLVQRKNEGLDVQVLLDDDSLLIAKGHGGFDMTSADANTFTTLVKNQVDVRVMETNEAAKDGSAHLFHNKFVIADDRLLFQGAGNFTGTALNVAGGRPDNAKIQYGNYEQYYLIEDQGIVAAYVRAFAELKARATKPTDHPQF